MMQHRRTLASVKTMAPALLADQSSTGDSTNEKVSPADAAAGSPKRTTSQTDETLSQQMVGLNSQIQTLLQSAESNMTEAHQLKSRAGEATAQAKLHGAWPVENVAARRGVALSSIREALNDPSGQSSAGSNSKGKPASSVNVSGMTNLDAIALQQIMDIRASHVDRVEAMPSPYYYEVLHNFEQRVIAVQRDVDAVRSRLAIAEEAERVQAAISEGRMVGNEASLLLSGGNANTMMMLYENNGHRIPLPQKLASLARSHSDAFIQISAHAARAHEGLAEVKLRYQRLCQQRKGYYDDPFLKADVEEISREREMQHRIREEQIATAPPPEPKPAQAAPSTGLFGAKSPAPATGGGLFGAPGEKLFPILSPFCTPTRDAYSFLHFQRHLAVGYSARHLPQHQQVSLTRFDNSTSPLPFSNSTLYFPTKAAACSVLQLLLLLEADCLAPPRRHQQVSILIRVMVSL